MLGLVLVMLMGLGTESDGPQDEAIDLARKALAERLGIAASEPVLEAAEPVDWPNAALGCSSKGEVSAQVVTPGFRVRLRVGEDVHEVRVGGGRARLCSDAAGAAPVNFVQAGVRVAGLARQHLASRLGLDPKDVKIDSLKATTWPDQRLGCDQEPPPADAASTRGYLITLRARDKEYVYHSDLARAVACGKD
jgi:hypothetical protein